MKNLFLFFLLLFSSFSCAEECPEKWNVQVPDLGVGDLPTEAELRKIESDFEALFSCGADSVVLVFAPPDQIISIMHGIRLGKAAVGKSDGKRYFTYREAYDKSIEVIPEVIDKEPGARQTIRNLLALRDIDPSSVAPGEMRNRMEKGGLELTLGGEYMRYYEEHHSEFSSFLTIYWAWRRVSRREFNEVSTQPTTDAFENNACSNFTELDLEARVEGFAFYHIPDSAYACAREQDKPILLYFSGRTAFNCRKMEENVFTDPEVRPLLRDRYVILRLLVDEHNLTIRNEAGEEEDYGDWCLSIEQEWFGAIAQPLFVVIDADENFYTGAWSYTPNAEIFADSLRAGLRAYRER